jgi:hypothetical protein
MSWEMTVVGSGSGQGWIKNSRTLDYNQMKLLHIFFKELINIGLCMCVCGTAEIHLRCLETVTRLHCKEWRASSKFVFGCLDFSCACCLHHSSLTGCSQTSAIFRVLQEKDYEAPRCSLFGLYVNSALGQAYTWTEGWKYSCEQNYMKTKTIFLQIFFLEFRSHIIQLPFITGGFKLYFTLDSWNHKHSVYEFRFPIEHKNISINSPTFHCA